MDGANISRGPVGQSVLNTGKPQIITSNGSEAAVLISYEEYRRLKARQKSLVEFLRESPLNGSEIDLERSQADAGRASLNFAETE